MDDCDLPGSCGDENQTQKILCKDRIFLRLKQQPYFESEVEAKSVQAGPLGGGIPGEVLRPMPAIVS